MTDPSADLPLKVLGVPGTAGADAEPPPVVGAVVPVGAGDGAAGVEEAPAMMDDASDGEMVFVLVL